MSPNRELAYVVAAYIRMRFVLDPMRLAHAPFTGVQFEPVLQRDYASLAELCELLRMPRTISPQRTKQDHLAEAGAAAQKLADRLNAIPSALQSSVAMQEQLSGTETRAIIERLFAVQPPLIAQVSNSLEFIPSLVAQVARELEKRYRMNESGMFASWWRSGIQRIRQGQGKKRFSVVSHLVPDILPDDTDAAVRELEQQLLQNPAKLQSAIDELHSALPFEMVQQQELDEIGKLRVFRGGELIPAEPVPEERALSSKLIGLCISGGGIRSATFNLGVLQAMAGAGFLPRIDYLSTVSGGGYIGSWLTAWIKRARSIHSVQRAMYTAADPHPRADEAMPIRRLREYSNYLTPRTGMFSADGWTMWSIYFRNAFLNFLTIFFALATALLLPRVLHLGFNAVRLLPLERGWDAWGLTGCTLAALLISLIWIGRGLTSYEDSGREDKRHPERQRTTRGPTQGQLQSYIVIPVLLAGFLIAGFLWNFRVAWNPFPSFSDKALGPVWTYSFIGGGISLFILVLITGLARYSRCFTIPANDWSGPTRAYFVSIVGLACIVAAAGCVLLIRILLLIFTTWYAAPESGQWIALIVGPPLVLEVLTIAIILQLGLLGLNFPDERREWWSRLGAWAHIYAAGWILLTTFCVFGPRLIGQAGEWLAAGIGGGWLLTSAAGAYSAYNSGTGKSSSEQKTSGWRETLAGIAPYVFVVGILFVVSFAVNFLLLLISDRLLGIPKPFGSLSALAGDDYWNAIELPPGLVVIAFALSGLITCLLTWRIDVNEFSLHHFYKNRLVRAYLGASHRRAARRPNAATGFDLSDDIKLTRMQSFDELNVPNPIATHQPMKEQISPLPPAYDGPLHIINTSLNVTTGEDLATQERQSESFVFTPLYCGFEFVNPDDAALVGTPRAYGYRPTRFYGYGEDNGIGLGTALAISGAAASPSMGYHSSPPVAFLLTLLNIRLGWWLGNPSSPHYWRYSSPRFGLSYLLSDLFGLSSTARKYVNLTDGGHFENLGIYELVRRRCRYIVCCDAEQDGEMTFNGLGTAIRRCRADFGAEIKIELKDLRRDPTTGLSRKHFAAGTILYPELDPQGKRQEGVLIYVKASLTGDEPVDVLEYASREKAFPHQSTADQWFDESQFESYRRLGEHIGDDVIATHVEALW